MLRKMRDDWSYGSATELKLWGRGVDMNIFSPERRSQQFRQSKGISETDIVILWVGRLVPEKRPDIWLGVVKRLQDEGLPVKPLVVGSGTFERYLTQLKNATCCGWLSGAALGKVIFLFVVFYIILCIVYGIYDIYDNTSITDEFILLIHYIHNITLSNVNTTNITPTLYIGEAYASSDILLFPSDVETFGNVTLEALSSGCPAIVEKKCGEHLVDHGNNGMTCQNDDAEAFYQVCTVLYTVFIYIYTIY